jgi:hypothetical protein
MVAGALIGMCCAARLAAIASLAGLILWILGSIALLTMGTPLLLLAGFVFAGFGPGKLLVVALDPDVEA